MTYGKLIPTCLLLFAAPLLLAQSDAIASLRLRLLRAGPNCILKINGLHATTDFFNRPAEMHIVNGLLSRGTSRVLHGKVDIPFPAGQHVQVIRVETVANNKSDALRLLLAAGNTAIPASFDVEKDHLLKMTEEQLFALIDPILLLPQAPAEPARPISRTAPAQPNPRPPVPEEKPSQPLIPTDAVQSIELFLRKNRQVTFRLEGLHGAMASPDFTRDNRIVSDVFEPRPASEIRKGVRDMRFPSGQQAEFVSLTPLASDGNDILRLIVRAPIGAFIPIAFVLPKDTLAAMSEEQIHQAILAAVILPPLVPPHPANTVVDLKPAATGFPLMRASENAPDGCWYMPYLSRKWDLEAAVMDCETNSWKTRASDTAHGIAFQVAGTEPVEVFTINTKPADQSIEAAIRQQFIMKSKSPAVRAGCRAQCKVAADGLVNCEVAAFGPYAKQKRFQSHGEKGDAEEPCPGLASDDVYAVFFLYRPTESKTKFLFFNADDRLGGLNLSTIHFLPEL